MDKSEIQKIYKSLEKITSEDTRERLEAVKQLYIVAKILGPKRTESEILPYFSELYNDEEKILFEVSNQLFLIASYLHDNDLPVEKVLKYYYHLLNYEDSSIRNKTLNDLEKLLMKFNEKTDFVYILIIKLLESKKAKGIVSACRIMCRFFNFFPNKYHKEMLRFLENSSLLSNCFIKTELLISLKFITDDNHIFKDSILKIFAKLINDNFETVQISTLQTICNSGYSSKIFNKYLLPFIRERFSHVSWRIRYVIASNFEKIFQKIELSNHVDCLKAFSFYLNDSEIEVVITSIGKFSKIIKFLSESQIKTIIFPILENTVKRPESVIRIEVGRNIFYLAQNLKKEDIKTLLFPLLETLMADYISELKLALFEKIDILVDKVGIEDSETIFLSIFQRLEKDKDWHTRDKSLVTFENILNGLPEEYIIKKHNLEILKKNLNDPVFEIRSKTFRIIEDLASRISRDNFFTFLFPIIVPFKDHPKYSLRMNFLLGVKKLFNFLKDDYIRELIVILYNFSSDLVANIRLVAFIVMIKIYMNMKEDFLREYIRKSIDILKNDKDKEIKRNIETIKMDKFDESLTAILKNYD